MRTSSAPEGEERIEFILDAIRRDPTTRDLIYRLVALPASLKRDDVPVAPAGFERLVVLVGGEETFLAALEAAVAGLLQSAAYRLVRADPEAAPALVADFLAAADDVPATAVILVLGDAEVPLEHRDVEVRVHPDPSIPALLADIRGA